MFLIGRSAHYSYAVDSSKAGGAILTKGLVAPPAAIPSTRPDTDAMIKAAEVIDFIQLTTEPNRVPRLSAY